MSQLPEFSFKTTTLLLHCCSAIAVLVLWQTSSNLKSGKGNLPVYIPQLVRVPGTNLTNSSNEVVFAGEFHWDYSLSIPGAILTFFVLSATFQGLATYYDPDALWIRYAEYSISASIMLVCIAAESGIRDVYTLILLAFMMFNTNLMGLFCDFLLGQQRYISWWFALVPHAVGWVDAIVAYSLVLVQFGRIASLAQPPWFVFVIVPLMAVLFLAFGCVQTYDIVGQSEISCISATYDGLSFVSKSLLAWLVLAPAVQGVF